LGYFQWSASILKSKKYLAITGPSETGVSTMFASGWYQFGVIPRQNVTPRTKLSPVAAHETTTGVFESF
jgi:hypothetical protein